MNTAINQNDGIGNGIAFLFGAVFNLLANVKLLFLLDYTLQAIVGGIICLGFKVLGDILSPLWQKHKDKVQDFASLKKVKKLKLARRKRNAKD
ncbi:MAG: hypothetical protein O9340_07995 [Cyclobacteriaceae bacterium]|nr:hypothetical protein [Cyclobacteriaceae bacterium]